jgi:hypothetical protein
MPTFEVLVSKMQHIISNNDMTDSEEWPPTFSLVTNRFLKKIYQVLRPKDAIVITGSCIVARTLEEQGLPSFLPGDIDVFVKEKLKMEDDIFNRSFLITNILLPLEVEGIQWQPRHIPMKDGGLHFKSILYGNCTIDIVDIIEFSLFKSDLATNDPKIQIIVVADDSLIPKKLPSFCLTPFEHNVVTSFDIDIVQGAYNPITSAIIFEYNDTEENIRNMEFWYICDPKRPFLLSSAIQRIQKYTDRGFTFRGLRDFNDPDLALLLPQFQIRTSIAENM